MQRVLYRIVFGEYTKVLRVNRNFGDFIRVFYLPSCLRICHKYFNVHVDIFGEYANRHKIEPITENLRPKPKKIPILNHFTEYDRMDH